MKLEDLIEKYHYLFGDMDDKENPFGGFECGDGWYHILDDLLGNLSHGIEIRQIKEKLGELRFYADGLSDEDYEHINAAVVRSSTVCESCGEAGTIRNDLGWIKTLCDVHHAERKEKKPKGMRKLQ